MKAQILPLLLSLSASGLFAQTCNTATLTGTYGFSVSGTAANDNNVPVTVSEVGALTLDGKGAFSGFGALTSGGKVDVIKFDGQIAIGADCTATGKFVLAGASLDFDLVAMSGGADFSLVIRAPGSTLSGYGTKVEGNCSAASLTGNYGYQGNGVVGVNGRAVSLAEIGVLAFDGKGGFTGTYSIIGGGEQARQSISGVYEVVPEACFATAAYKVGADTYQFNIIITNRGNQILYSEFASAYVATGSGARLFPQ